MATKELVSLLLPLIGVVIGGLITFFIQHNVMKRTHAFEREKIRQDNLNKDEVEKFKAYNRILINNGTHTIHEYDRNTGGELDYQKYLKYVRPVLFDVFHLLDKEIADELIEIEYIYEVRQIEQGKSEGDNEKLRSSYIKIIKTIIRKYKEQHEKHEEFKSA